MRKALYKKHAHTRTLTHTHEKEWKKNVLIQFSNLISKEGFTLIWGWQPVFKQPQVFFSRPDQEKDFLPLQQITRRNCHNFNNSGTWRICHIFKHLRLNTSSTSCWIAMPESVSKLTCKTVTFQNQITYNPLFTILLYTIDRCTVHPSLFSHWLIEWLIDCFQSS